MFHVLQPVEFLVIPPDRIPEASASLGALLAPAVREHAGMALSTVLERMASGSLHTLSVKADGARGVFVFDIYAEGDAVICWASYIAGTVAGGPRQWLKVMRAIMTAFEQRCRDAGCTEIRVGGRDWSRVFPDYAFIDRDVNNDMRKVL